MTPPRRTRTRIEVWPTHYRPGWAALVWAVIGYRKLIIAAYFGPDRAQVEADAEQYRAAILAGGVLP